MFNEVLKVNPINNETRKYDVLHPMQISYKNWSIVSFDFARGYMVCSSQCKGKDLELIENFTVNGFQ